MSCQQGCWCFVSFLPPRLRVLLARTKNRACFHWWEYGLLTNRIICAGVSKGPLVCAFHLRVSCRWTMMMMMMMVVLIGVAIGQGVEIGAELVLPSR